MRPNHGGPRVPPGRGGYEFEVVELGPPVYHTPVPPAKYRGPLIPAGDGEGLPPRPAPSADLRTRSTVPLVPTQSEVCTLPRWARVAFAARCARRVLPAVWHIWKDGPAAHPQAVENAVRAAEDSARVAANREDSTSARDAVFAATDTPLRAATNTAVAYAVAWAADTAASAAGSDWTAAKAAADAARVIFETATIDTPLTAQLRCVRRDFVRLKRLAREHKWTDDTPVPPDVFGPMWPEGVAPYWAVELPPPPST